MARKSETKSKTPLIPTPLKSPPIFPHLTAPQPVHGESVPQQFRDFDQALRSRKEPLLFASYETTPPRRGKIDGDKVRCFEHPELLPCTFRFLVPRHNPDDHNAEINYELLRRESIQSRVSVPIIDTARCADELLRQGYVDDALFLYEKFFPFQLSELTSHGSWPERTQCHEKCLLRDIPDENRRREVFIQLWLASKDASALSEFLGTHTFSGNFGPSPWSKKSDYQILQKLRSLMSPGEKAVLNGVPPEGVMLYRGTWGFEYMGLTKHATPARTWTNDSDRAHEDAEEARRAASAEYGSPLVPKIEKVRVERDDIALLFLSDPGFVVILKPNCGKKPRAFAVK